MSLSGKDCPGHRRKDTSKFPGGTKTASIAALQRVAGVLGRSPVADGYKNPKNGYDKLREKGEPCVATVLDTFNGSWNAALEAAGLKLNRQPDEKAVANGYGKRKYTDEELLDAVRTVNKRVPDGYVLRADLYDDLKQDGEPCNAIIRKRFRNELGTWVEIREHALEPHGSFISRILEQVKAVR